ncbi:aminoacyl-tRNA hydrolase [Chloroflexota bacterium]
MKLIIGLGNPGRKYEKNRHNLGFMCLSHFARTHAIKFDKRQAGARIGSGEANGSQVTLARPQTYMNQSGLAVSRLVNKFNVNLDDLLVIHDDLDLPTGKIRLRRGGGSGGHKGIDSMATELGSQDFTRLRVGIGRPDNLTEIDEADIIDYVLGDFTIDEKQVISQILPGVSEAILCLLDEGLTIAMNKYN